MRKLLYSSLAVGDIVNAEYPPLRCAIGLSPLKIMHLIFLTFKGIATFSRYSVFFNTKVKDDRKTLKANL